MDSTARDLNITNIGTLSTPFDVSSDSENFWEIRTLQDAYIVVRDGIIKEIGTGSASGGGRTLDAEGRAVVPAFCDPHTHAVFSGWRSGEFVQRLQGAGYKEILAAGGGILSTVRATAGASESELTELLVERLSTMLTKGVLTCEVKSGYGLQRSAELKMLRAIHAAARESEIEVVPTFMGAHAVPEEYSDDAAGYLREAVIPLVFEVAESGLAEYVDVFCEPDVFETDLAREVLKAGQEAGLHLRIHADEMEAAGGTALAAEMGCTSAEHLLSAPDEELLALRDADVTAVLLPGTAFMLGESFARARWMIDNGVTVALGSDFNPGSCPIIDLHLIMSLACLKMQMTPEEVLVAVTRNAARSVGRFDRGVIGQGFRGDVVLLDAENYTHLMYRPGANLVSHVISGGRQVYCRG